MSPVVLASTTIALAAFLAGCAAPSTKRVEVTTLQTSEEARKQMDLLAEELMADQARLQRVHWQVATKSTSLCPKLTRAPGMYTMVLPKGEMASSMSRLFGVTAQPTVVTVVPDSPADRAGVKPRDVLLSAWGLPAVGRDLEAIRERSRQATAGEAMPVQLRRNGEPMDLTLEPVLACDYQVALTTEQVLNAYADGDRIFVTRGMMAFARTDEELALVVAHEMAHNTMRHTDAKRVNATLGMVADVALTVLSRGMYSGSAISGWAGNAHSQEFEAEADYVGLYMMANSGYAIAEAPKFWRRMAVASPGSIKGSHTASHPPTSYRMVALEEAAREIEDKRTAMAALVPIRKDGKPFVPGDGTMVVALPMLASSFMKASPKAPSQTALGNSGVTTIASGPREVVGCVPVGTKAGDRISLREWGMVDVKSLADGNAECGANVPATFVQVSQLEAERN